MCQEVKERFMGAISSQAIYNNSKEMALEKVMAVPKYTRVQCTQEIIRRTEKASKIVLMQLAQKHQAELQR